MGRDEQKDGKERASDALADLRVGIDGVDDRIVALLNERAALARRVGEVKSEHNLRAYVPERERQLLERLTSVSEGPLPGESVRRIYKEIISASLALESPLEVAFLGPEATFTHEATKRQFGMSARLNPRQTIADVFGDVERGRCDHGVVPIENSTEGVVNHTLDSFMNTRLTIGAEVLLAVSHHLVNRSGNLKGITKVYSHPQALAQCRSWLGKNLPSVALVDVSSTARAAQLAAEDDSAAAVASDMAASLYGLRVTASHLEDLKDNLTRFLVIGHEQPEPTGNDRTSLMFALKDAPGILFEALGHLASAGINMSRIESRPSRRRAWDYLFFVDLEGHLAQAAVTDAVEGLGTTCEFLKVLGSYPRGSLEPLRTPRRG